MIMQFFNLYGDLQFEPFSMDAGESVNVVVEWNWAER